MKVIDLLNKIANGEQPKKIKYKNDIYIFEKYCGKEGYVNKNYPVFEWFANEIECDLKKYLNEEIEIIEDTPKDKKIEKIEDSFFSGKDIINKINEIIDKVNGE